MASVSHECLGNRNGQDSHRSMTNQLLMPLAVVIAWEVRLHLFPSRITRSETRQSSFSGQLKSRPDAGGVPLCSEEIVSEILGC